MRRTSPSSSSLRARGRGASRLSPAVAPSHRVLVVDDDLAERDLLVRLLAEKGYPASGACDSQHAFREVFLRWPDLILLDLEMPAMDGWEFLRIRSEYPRLACIPVVVLSAADAPPAVAAVIRKPILVEEVLHAVHRILGPGTGRPLLTIVRGNEP
jgi:CheY-like chemotaxis protein